MIFNPILCPNCKLNTFRIYEKKSNNILNLYYIKCINIKSQTKKNLRNYSFLKFAKSTPISIIYEIIWLFLIENKNGKDIHKYLANRYHIKPYYKTILKILKTISQVIAEYLKYKYKSVQIGDDPNEDITVALDETLITHCGGTSLARWYYNTRNKNIRLDILPSRDANTLKILVKNHIIPGTNITHDGWAGYLFLDDDDSVWTHESHNHGHLNLVQGNTRQAILQVIGDI